MRPRALAVWLTLLCLPVVPSPSAASKPRPVSPVVCYPVCRAQCLKPWSIPDRWDDSGRPGWPQWAKNGHWDSEKFTDVDGDRLWSPGEPFFDGVDAGSGGDTPMGAQDGQYTCELYDPMLTGYLAARDLGELMTLRVASPGDAYEPGQLCPIDLPIPGEPDVGADRFRWNIANCNPSLVGPGDYLTTENGNMIGPTAQGVADLIAQDPGAYWDPVCQCVKGSEFGNASPRIVIVLLHDPRIPLASGKNTIRAAKLAALFLEDVQGRDIRARFVVARAARGERCPPEVRSAGYLEDCPNARAFLHGGNRTTRLDSGRPATCVQVEPLGEAFELADVDPASVTMRLAGGFPPAPPASIPGTQEASRKLADFDRNGIVEASVCFAKEDLRQLLSAVRGSETVVVEVEGLLLPRDSAPPVRWWADLALPVVGPEAGPELGPGPVIVATRLGGEVPLAFTTSRPGPARVTLYDLRGRLIRTLLDAPRTESGTHRLRWDCRSASGERAGRGIYFYRIETPEGTKSGRIVIVG